MISKATDKYFNKISCSLCLQEIQKQHYVKLLIYSRECYQCKEKNKQHMLSIT